MPRRPSSSSALGQRLLAALLRVFPQPPQTDELRHRFSAISITVAVALAAFTTPAFAWVNPATAVVTGGFGVLTALLGLALRLTRSSTVAFWGLQGLCISLIVLGAWTETGPHTDWAMWLAILPLTGMLYGGNRPGFIGLALGIVCALLIVLAPTPPLFDPRPVTLAATLTRVLSFFAALGTLGALWQVMRTKALERAEAAGKARTLFLANMSHELRTPMNGVIGLTEVLRLSNPRPEQAETLEVMRRSGQQLLALINNIIDFARLDAGRMVLEQAPVELGRLVLDTVELVGTTVKPGGPVLEASVAPDVPRWISGDDVRLRQVMTNLVGNAVKFTPSGKVTLEVRRDGERLLISVRDTGLGISPEVQRRLFRPFEQAEAGSNRRYAGSGLGLAISRELVERMGGQITLESALGQGSTFTVVLPLVATEVPELVTVMTEAPPLGAGRSVLVVDDNEVNLLVAVSLLKKAGYRSETARSGLEAVAAVTAVDFDVVLMDCHMPELDGYEATRRIRALDSPRRSTPIIALTASALKEELDRCTEAGMDDCLTKPVTLAMLSATLGRVLGRGRRGGGDPAAEPTPGR